MGTPQRKRGGQGPRPGRRASRALLLAATAITAGALGAAGTLLQQWITAPDTSAVDAQAAEIAEDLRGSLNAGFHSGGQTYGGQFTEGTIAAHIESHGGVLLSSDTDGNRGPADTNSVEAMLGLTPPNDEGVAAGTYPVRCYRYSFGTGTYSVKHAGIPCPTTRTDGRPGSLVAQMGALLTQSPSGPASRRSLTTKGYAHTLQGAMDFLEKQQLITTSDKVTAARGRPAADGVYVLALRINGTCHYLRMDPAPTAADLRPLWPAPADEQRTCDTHQATTAATLYGTNPSALG
ncbi:hypothetical protein [Streptomyces sp. E-08]|uniref:hypothetical protein n=1 Tax=Streptomyces sp. E-08 TaxID=3404047 RepID=UPI003CE9C6D2